MRKLRKVILIILSYILLIFVWIFIRLVKYKTVILLIKKINCNDKKVNPRLIVEICSIVHSCSKYAIPQMRCLERSIVCKILCRSVGVNLGLCIGVKRYPFESHAWNVFKGFPIYEDKREIQNYKIIHQI